MFPIQSSLKRRLSIRLSDATKPSISRVSPFRHGTSRQRTGSEFAISNRRQRRAIHYRERERARRAKRGRVALERERDRERERGGEKERTRQSNRQMEMAPKFSPLPPTRPDRIKLLGDGRKYRGSTRCSREEKRAWIERGSAEVEEGEEEGEP